MDLVLITSAKGRGELNYGEGEVRYNIYSYRGPRT